MTVSTVASDDLVANIENRSARIATIGLGYVGLPLLLGFHDCGFPVLGVDIDSDKVNQLLGGKSYIKHISADRTAALASSSRFDASTDFSRLADVDIIIICVPTPLNKHLDPDMTYIVTTTESIAPNLRRGQLVVLESTTYPGTTRDVMQPLLEKGSGLTGGQDFFVAFSPEREDPGNLRFETKTIPKVVGAIGQRALNAAVALYGTLVPQVVPVSSPEVAEATKLTENIFRSVNIAMVNELKVIYDIMGIDVWEVIEAASTKPFGYMPFHPGPGLGGHCIPIDPFYLSWFARSFGLRTRFIELSGEINRQMPSYVVGKLTTALNERLAKAVSRARVLIVGIAYKKNVDDMRESPSLVLIELLEKAGAHVDFYDPYIPIIPMTREHAKLAGRKSVAWSAEVIEGYDAVLISTDHDGVDLHLAEKVAPLIIDTRNACARLGLASAKIIKA